MSKSLQPSVDESISIQGTPTWRILWRKLYWRKTHRRLKAKYHGLQSCLIFGGQGIGDELLLSTVLHEQRRRGHAGIGLMTSHSSLFQHSPDVDHVHPIDFADVNHLSAIGIKTLSLGYIKATQPPDIDVPPDRHIIGELCRQAGLAGQIALRPYLFLTPEECTPFKRDQPYLVMQTSRNSASFNLANKEWFPARFSEVAQHLSKQIDIIQIGQPSDPAIPNAVDFRGKTTLRESAALLSKAQGFIGLVGFLMHLARAVDCPSVIVYGGREHPDQSGYPCNQNLFSELPCSPCWRRSSCDFERRCMTEITSEHVIAATEKLLAETAEGHPLITNSLVLPPT